MSRLTERDGRIAVRVGGCTKRHDPVFDKLAHYEDLEEQGRLIELPCKVGEEVWTIDKEFGIQLVEYQVAHRIVFDMWAGYAFAKTKEEALAKWAELKEGGVDD